MSVLHKDVVCIKSTMMLLMYGKSFHSTEQLTPLNEAQLLSYSSANCESHCYYSVGNRNVLLFGPNIAFSILLNTTQIKELTG